MAYNTNIVQTRIELTVKELYDLYEAEKLLMNPRYQRDYIAHERKVWQQNLIKNIIKGSSVIPYLYMRTRPDKMVDGELVQGYNLFPATEYNGALMVPEHLEGDIHDKVVKLREDIIAELVEVIDGQQRLRTLVDFLNDKFILPKGLELTHMGDPARGGMAPPPTKIGKLTASQLKEQRPAIFDKFLKHRFTVVATMGADTAIHRMFLDLNDLNQMVAQEKRNAEVADISDWVRHTARAVEGYGDEEGENVVFHPLFSKADNKGMYIKTAFKKMAQDEVLAKIFAIADGFPSATFGGLSQGSLNALYKTSRHITAVDDKVAKKVTDILDICYDVLSKEQDSKILASYNVGTLINFILCVNELMFQKKQKLVKVRDWGKVYEWFNETHIKLMALTNEEKALGFNETLYRTKTRLASDNDGLDMRITMLKKEGLYHNDGVQLIDQKRVITDHEFRWMWIMADKKCTVPHKTTGKIHDRKILLEDAVKAHIVAHSNGGDTTVENTYVSCKGCNKIRVQDEEWITDEKLLKKVA